ncbi:hypothetical protein HK100_004562 [Physocladia obscura]|uniref:SET domain-containing protein n=1 Tax=Physocladia obscura TaxID=109957 RepID=A0AAD5X9U8_9FUNG|nr:hypothetical protein HK100_004562 [Physocladia obscura]
MESHSILHTNYECSRYSELAAIPTGKAFSKLLASADAHLSPESTLMRDSYERADILELTRWLLNFCIRIEIEREFGPGLLKDLPTYSDFLELVPNIESVSNDEILQMRGLHHIFSTLKTIKSKFSIPSSFAEVFQTALPEPKDLIKVICIKQCNGFGLWDQEGECMGHAVFPAASFFNHSCSKNLEREIGMRLVLVTDRVQNAHDSTCTVIDSSDMGILKALQAQVDVVMLAKRDIRKGELVTHSYVDPSWNREKRRQYLKDVYYFDCNCERCEVEI